MNCMAKPNHYLYLFHLHSPKHEKSHKLTLTEKVLCMTSSDQSLFCFHFFSHQYYCTLYTFLPPTHADIDECAMDTDNCQQSCLNTIGSFSCTCFAGFTLADDGANCRGKTSSRTCSNIFNSLVAGVYSQYEVFTVVLLQCSMKLLLYL